MLVDLDEEGNLVTRPFDNTASEQIAEGSRRSSRANPNAGQDDWAEEPDQETEEDLDDEDVDDSDTLF